MIPVVERNPPDLALQSGGCRVPGSQRPAPEGYGLEVSSGLTTILFTDIEGSTRLWEQEGERMAGALAQHDARARAAVDDNHGVIVKTTGDGLFAAFHDPLDAINATVAFQRSLVDPAVTNGIPIRVRCGLHLGVLERRDNDYFGTPVNRTARIMSVAHGGQILISQAVVEEVGTRLPASITLLDLGSVRLKDLSSPEHVYQVVHPDLRADFPALHQQVRALSAIVSLTRAT